MQKQHKWLLEEIPKWLSDGLIDETLADKLRQRYPFTERAWGRIIFSTLGAVLAGLGVILFFAYNWEDLPKAAKLALVFAALMATHGGALWAAKGSAGERKSVVEGLHVLGTMLFGAGIWLIAQIYHIDEHYPNALLVWSLGALALAWALPSLAQAFVAVFLIALWAGFEAVDFHWANHWAPLMIAVGILPLAWTERSRVLLFFGLLGFLAVCMLAAVPVESGLLVSTAFYLGCLYITVGLLTEDTDFPTSHRVFKTIGFMTYLVFLYIFSFPDGVEVLDDVSLSKPMAIVYFGLPLGLAVLAWVWPVLRPLRGMDGLWRWHWCLVGVSMVFATCLTLQLQFYDWYAAAPFNILFLIHCIVFIVQGTRESNAKLVASACVLLALLAITRYVDLFDSLLLRSAVFLLLGGGLFVVGNFYSRSKREIAGGGA